MTFSLAGTVALGALSGLSVFAGLPVARLGRPGQRRMAFLTSASVGILLFILYDVLKNASATVETAMAASRLRGAGYALLLAAGLSAGVLGLVVFERLTLRRRRPALPSGPGALAAGDVAAAGARREPMAPAHRVALFIAMGIGLHNFSEGLAIGQSAAGGVYRLLWLLVIGFALHNVTEGFGITAPLMGERPSWSFLAVLGLCAGGPTLVGAGLGYGFVSDALSVTFLALAAGAIMYVVGELQHAGRRIGAREVALVGLLAGFLVAYGTDLLLGVAGA